MRSNGMLRSSPFLDVYYFADLAMDILRDPFSSGGEWSDFMSDLADEMWEQAYPRWTTMHRFLSEMIGRSMYERDFASAFSPDLLRSVAGAPARIPFEQQRLKLGVERALDIYGLSYDRYVGWPDEDGLRDDDAFYEWYQDLRLTEAYDRLLRSLAEDVFTILFAHREVLFLLNDWLATKMKRESRGPTKRCDPPTWARRAVFFRDRGRCCGCGTDLSGLLSLHIAPSFDHVVALVGGGPNDVTNLQLLCSPCNGRKGSAPVRPTFTHEQWFEPDEHH